MIIFLVAVIFCLMIVILYKEDTIKGMEMSMSSISNNYRHYKERCNYLEREIERLKK